MRPPAPRKQTWCLRCTSRGVDLRCGHHRASEVAAMFPLHECSLVLKHRQCLLQAIDLSLAPPGPLCICLWLSDAPVLELAVELENCAELCVRRLAIRGVLGHGSVHGMGFLCLVLDVLLLQRPCDCILLA